MSDELKFTSTPEWDALNAFDAENNVEPTRVVACRIACKYAHSATENGQLIDEISHAIEDAMEIGARRGPLEAAAIRSSARANQEMT